DLGVYVSSNQGQSWTRTSTGLASGQVNRIVPIGNTLFAAVYNAGVYRSTDSGLNWTSANNGLTSLKINDLVLLGGNLYAATDDKGVLRSTDQGQSWSAAPNGGLPAGTILSMAASNNTLFAAVWDQAVYYSTDNGGTWVKSAGGFVNPYVAGLYVGRGIFTARADSEWGSCVRPTTGRTGGCSMPVSTRVTVAPFLSADRRSYAGGLNGVYASTCLVNQEVTVSAADYSLGSIVEKSIVAAYGVQLATGVETAASQPLPTMLAGTTVKVRDSNGIERLAPLFYVSPDQVNYEIPAGTAAGPATVMISNGAGFAAIGNMEVKSTAPKIFTANYSGSGAAAALDAFTYAPGPFDAKQSNGQPNILAIFGTGLGGDATEVAGDVAGSVTTRLNGSVITTGYAGTAPGYVGLNQFNIVLPEGITAGTYSLTVTRGGVTSNTVTITIR
ncbi:MAG: hypothetical protein IPL01_14685, partial [Acidobacteria bacterium]|nr:hypothetical protein [Acidobacteriota bacterium]